MPPKPPTLIDFSPLRFTFNSCSPFSSIRVQPFDPSSSLTFDFCCSFFSLYSSTFVLCSIYVWGSAIEDFWPKNSFPLSIEKEFSFMMPNPHLHLSHFLKINCVFVEGNAPTALPPSTFWFTLFQVSLKGLVQHLPPKQTDARSMGVLREHASSFCP